MPCRLRKRNALLHWHTDQIFCLIRSNGPSTLTDWLAFLIILFKFSRESISASFGRGGGHINDSWLIGNTLSKRSDLNETLYGHGKQSNRKASSEAHNQPRRSHNCECSSFRLGPDFRKHPTDTGMRGIHTENLDAFSNTALTTALSGYTNIQKRMINKQRIHPPVDMLYWIQQSAQGEKQTHPRIAHKW